MRTLSKHSTVSPIHISISHYYTFYHYMLTRLSVCLSSVYRCSTRFKGRQQLFLPVASFAAYPTRHQVRTSQPSWFPRWHFSRLDDCNSVLGGWLAACTTEPLQRVLNVTAPLVLNLYMCDHVTPILYKGMYSTRSVSKCMHRNWQNVALGKLRIKRCVFYIKHIQRPL